MRGQSVTMMFHSGEQIGNKWNHIIKSLSFFSYWLLLIKLQEHLNFNLLHKQVGGLYTVCPCCLLHFKLDFHWALWNHISGAFTGLGSNPWILNGAHIHRHGLANRTQDRGVSTAPSYCSCVLRLSIHFHAGTLLLPERLKLQFCSEGHRLSLSLAALKDRVNESPTGECLWEFSHRQKSTNVASDQAYKISICSGFGKPFMGVFAPPLWGFSVTMATRAHTLTQQKEMASL